MATQRPVVAVPITDFPAALLAEREVNPRVRITARHVKNLVPNAAVLVYVAPDPQEPSWQARALEGEATIVDPVLAIDQGLLGKVWLTREPLVVPGAEIPREEFSHVHVRRSIASLAYFPCATNDRVVAAIEVISFDAALSDTEISAINGAASYAAVAISSAIAYETERNASLESVSRLTQLYDLEKVFAATLEMDELMPIISTKVQQLYDAQAVNLWMVEGDAVILMSQAGVDPTTHVGQRQQEHEGIAGDLTVSGETLLIEHEENEQLLLRNQGVEQGAIHSLIAAPVTYDENLVGLLEVVNKSSGKPFDEDDLFTLTQISEVAGSALHNAFLLQAERKVEILQTLVEVSQQITSTLNIERVLESVVNQPRAVIPYERATIALEDKGKLQVRAVTGMSPVNPLDPDVRRLEDILRWAAGIDKEMYVKRIDGEVDDPRPNTREKFKRYFEETGVNGFFVLPLSDDQGSLGVLSLESSDPEFLNEAHLEMIKVLAGQATVALRNASLYREVPFIGVLEPLLHKKRKFMAMEKRRRLSAISLAALALVFLVAFPLPMRVDGNASVAPTRASEMTPLEDGVVSRIYVREGDRVQKGTILAEMENWKEKSALATAEAKYQEALSAMNRALAQNDGTVAGQKRVEADYWSGEINRDREMLDHTLLRANIDGLVATPHTENLVGRKFDAGQTILELVDTSKAVVDLAIPESDIPLVQVGKKAAVKLEGFPTRTFRGQVSVVSPKGTAGKDSLSFYARVEVPNSDGVIRAGMQGRGKVSVGWRPAGYVMFRDFGAWIWSKLWSLAGW